MKRTALLAFAAALSAIVFAQPPPGYYDAASGLTGPALKAALFGIISPHTVHSYAQLWNDFESTDDRDDNGKVWDIYSDIPDSVAPYQYTFGTDQCGSYNSEGDCYNREHTVPQSWFNGDAPMVSDLFHIYPTDGWVNNKRGDLPHGEVSSADWTGQNGTKTGNSATAGYSGTVCEPIDAYKGDLARTYFYMMTRYMNVAGTWTSDMFAAGDLTPWAKNMLLQWDTDDPVSQKEIDRNNAVYAIQDNRNPYIDHPEWTHSIWVSTVGIPPAKHPIERLWVHDGMLYRSGPTDISDVRIIDMSGREVYRTRFQGNALALPDLPHALFIARSGTSTVRFAR